MFAAISGSIALTELVVGFLAGKVIAKTSASNPSDITTLKGAIAAQRAAIACAADLTENVREILTAQVDHFERVLSA